MEPWFDEQERDAMNQYLSDKVFLTEYKQTQLFEKSISSYTSSNYCVAVNNGTISLSLAAMAVELKPGDEVIIPNYTMFATYSSLKMLGLDIRLVDVELSSLCMDINLLRQTITDATKCIVFVSPNGRFPTYPMEDLIKICRDNNIYLIEDAAQGLGSFYPDKTHIGCKGDIGSLSFSAPKIISTGQGGMLMTNSETFSSRLKRLKDFGRSGGGNDIHDTVGFNFKFTDMQAVVGLTQMKKLDWRVERKKEIFRRYENNLKNVEGISLFEHDLNLTSPWFVDTLCKRRDELKVFLKSKNIGTREMYPPISSQKAVMQEGNFPVSENVGLNGLWLPSSSQLSDRQIDLICDAIGMFYS